MPLCYDSFPSVTDNAAKIAEVRKCQLYAAWLYPHLCTSTTTWTCSRGMALTSAWQAVLNALWPSRRMRAVRWWSPFRCIARWSAPGCRKGEWGESLEDGIGDGLISRVHVWCDKLKMESNVFIMYLCDNSNCRHVSQAMLSVTGAPSPCEISCPHAEPTLD